VVESARATREHLFNGTTALASDRFSGRRSFLEGTKVRTQNTGRVSSTDVLQRMTMTHLADVEMCWQAIKNGAADCLVKPFLEHQVIDAVTHALAFDRVQRSNAKARDRLQQRLSS
jgi:FixJ family two-component response regulator